MDLLYSDVCRNINIEGMNRSALKEVEDNKRHYISDKTINQSTLLLPF